MQDSAYTTQHQLRRGFNPQQIPICQQVHDLSVVQHVYVHALQIVHLTTYLYCNLRIPSKKLGFSLFERLRSSTSFIHIHLCLSLSNLYHKIYQHIYSLQQLTHAPQPYNMNAIQSCIRNSIIWKPYQY
jgi:hypothetical protein